jgi:hypothetical protein
MKQETVLMIIQVVENVRRTVNDGVTVLREVWHRHLEPRLDDRHPLLVTFGGNEGHRKTICTKTDQRDWKTTFEKYSIRAR